MPDDKRWEPLRKKPSSSADISTQPTRRESASPSNQIVLSESDFYSEGHATQQSGTRIGMPDKIGPYQIVSELGRGGMGVVYLAKQPSLNRDVALKVLNINLNSDPEDAARFKSEAKLAASLQHPNIVQIYEIGEQDSYAFMAMEYVPGGNLHQYLKTHSPTPREAAELLEPIARAMHHAHEKGIIHRDLKPGNILMVQVYSPPEMRGGGSVDGKRPKQRELSPEERRLEKTDEMPIGGLPLPVPQTTSAPSLPTVKITDFGLAKNINQSMHLTATGVALGTPSYMAPEQAKDDRKNIGPLSDVYALGAILYELLTGNPPFTGSTPLVTMQQVVRARPVRPSEVRPTVPRDLEAICLKCLEKHPKKRYASAQDLADALHAYLAEPKAEDSKAEKGLRWPFYALAASILIAIGFLVVAVVKHQDAKRQENIASQYQQLASDQTEQAKQKLNHALQDAQRQQLAVAMESAFALGELGQTSRALHILKELPRQESANQKPEVQRVIQINIAEWEEQMFRPVAGARQPVRINALGWSPDGKLLATAGEDGQVRFFAKDGTESGKPFVCPAPAFAEKRSAKTLAWSSTGDVLAVGGSLGHVYLIDPLNRAIRGEAIEPEGLNSEVCQVHFANANKTLIMGGEDGVVRLYDIPTRTWSSTLISKEEAASGVAISVSTNGKLVAAGGNSGVLRVWELMKDDSKVHRNWKLGGDIRALAFSPDQRVLVAATKTGHLLVWDRMTDQLTELPNEESSVEGIVFSADGQFFATASEGGVVRLWDAGSRTALSLPVIKDRGVYGISFHPTEYMLALGNDRGVIQFTSVPRTRQVRPPILVEPVKSSAIRSLALSRNGKAMLTVSAGVPRVWSSDADLKKHFDQTYSLVGDMHPGGNLVALGGRGGRLQLFDLEKDRNLFAMMESPFNADLRSVQFSPDGLSLLAIAGSRANGPNNELTNSAYLWAVSSSSKPRRVLEKLLVPVNAVAWHPDGRRIALACGDGKILLWQIEKNELVGSPFDLGTSAYCVAFSPDGKQLTAGGLDGTGKIWNLGDGQEVFRQMLHAERIAALAFSPDGKLVLTGSHDKTARYWDAATGWPLGPALQHPEAVLSVAIHPESKYAITGCKDAAVRFWRLPLVPNAREQ